MSIKEKIKYNAIANKYSYRKINIIDKLIFIFKKLFVLFMVFLPFIACFLLNYIISNINNDFTDFDKQILIDATIAFYGLQLTTFCIILSLKDRKIFNYNLLEILFKSVKYGNGIMYYVILENLFLVLFLLCLFLGVFPKVLLILIITFAFIIIIYSIYILKLSVPKILYKYFSKELDYIRINNKGNLVNKLDDNDAFNIETFLNELKNPKFNQETNKLIVCVDNIKRSFYYSLDDKSNNNSEILSIFIKKYIKNIKNDDDILYTYFIVSDFLNLFDYLLENKRYFELSDLIIVFLESYFDCLNCKCLNNRFNKLPLNSKNFISINLLEYRILNRNLYLLSAIMFNNDLIKSWLNANEKTINQNLYDIDFNKIKNQIEKIDKKSIEFCDKFGSMSDLVNSNLKDSIIDISNTIKDFVNLEGEPNE